MATHVSPGVFTTVIDLSSYLQTIPGTIGFSAFVSRRGPDNVLMYQTSLQEYADQYGTPNINDFGAKWSQGPYIAWNHMTVAPSMYALRCLPDDAAYSNLFVYMNVDSTNTAYTVSHELSMNTLAELETVLGQNVGPGDTPTLPAVNALTDDDLVTKNDHDSLSDDESPNLYIPVTGDRVASTVGNNIYEVTAEGNFWEIVGATYLSYNARAITAQDISSKNDLLPLSDDTGSVYTPLAGDKVYSVFDDKMYTAQASGTTWTSESLSTYDTFYTTYDFRNTAALASVTTVYTFNGSSVVLATDITYLQGAPNADSFFVQYDLTKSPNNKEVNAQYYYDTLTSTLQESTNFAGTGYPLMVFYPVGRGDSYDDFAVDISISANTNLEGVYDLNIWETQADGDDVIVESFSVSFIPTAVDESGQSLYVVDVLERYSQNMRVMLNETNINLWAQNGTDIVVGSTSIPIHLYGGSEGSIVSVDENTGKRTPVDTELITLLSKAYLGLIDDNVLDLDDVYMPLVYDAGYPTEVKDSIVKLTSELRLDGIAILDNGDNTSFTASIASRNDYHTYNTRYAALFEEYSKIFDFNTGKDIWVSPVYHMATMIPLTDTLYDIWWASAGFNRGTISGIKELRFSPKLNQRDQMYLDQLNPIVKFSVGYTMWGNLTTQRKPSALQDINVVRTVLYIKRTLEQFLKFYIFEFNDEETWNEMFNAIDPFLQDIKSRRGLTAYEIDVGATEYEIKTKRAHVNVQLTPTRVIERIELNLYVK